MEGSIKKDPTRALWLATPLSIRCYRKEIAVACRSSSLLKDIGIKDGFDNRYLSCSLNFF